MVQTAVDGKNCKEDMNLPIERINPYGWICYPARVSNGVETTTRAGNMAERLAVTNKEFVRFCARHENNACFEYQQSGLEGGVVLDENMCFQMKDAKGSIPPILKIGVVDAIPDLPST